MKGEMVGSYMDLFMGMLGTGAVSAIISSIFVYIFSRKQGKINYITNGREVLIENLMNITREINNSTNFTIKKCINELILWIDPYGEFSNEKFEDSHIWDNIKKIKAEKDSKKIEAYKEILVKYLIAKIAYEKAENIEAIKGVVHNVFLASVVIIYVVAYIYSYFYLLELPGDLVLLSKFLCIIIVLFSVALYKFILSKIKDIGIYIKNIIYRIPIVKKGIDYLNISSKVKAFLMNFLKVFKVLAYLIFVIVFILFIFVLVLVINQDHVRIIHEFQLNSVLGMICYAIPIFLAFLLYIITNINHNNMTKYQTTIKKIQEKYHEFL